jgi:hypothetical protein
MQTSFRSLKALLLLALTVILLPGCKKAITETCFDGIRNQNEKGIDCGGSCTPYPNFYGNWRVYKFLLNNIDKTTQFANQYPHYSLSFTQNGGYEEFYLNPDTIKTTGTYAVIDTDLSCSPVRIELNANIPARSYTVFNLTTDHMQLRNDTSQLYLTKN